MQANDGAQKAVIKYWDEGEEDWLFYTDESHGCDVESGGLRH